MSKTPMTISDEAKVQMPMKTVASLITLVALGTWAYFGIIETQNRMETTLKLMETDVVENTEFRIKWPRGELGSLPDDAEQNMRLKYLESDVSDMEVYVDKLRLKANIE